ncbi:UNVERIFIED_CONTAM: hypothetical protein KB579_10880, partial [Streptococcus canis]
LPVSFSRREKQENHQLCWWLTRLLASIYFSQYNLIVQVRQRRSKKVQWTILAWPKAVTVYHIPNGCANII